MPFNSRLKAAPTNQQPASVTAGSWEAGKLGGREAGKPGSWEARRLGGYLPNQLNKLLPCAVCRVPFIVTPHPIPSTQYPTSISQLNFPLIELYSSGSFVEIKSDGFGKKRIFIDTAQKFLPKIRMCNTGNRHGFFSGGQSS